MRLAFTVEYDGTDFSGFQKQKNASTIQEKIEEAIKTVTGSDITINYSGRTDAGVHALSQVFDFETSIKRDNKNWIDGINSNLPKTIAVKQIYDVPEDFDSRFSAIERRYSYVIYNSKNKPLFSFGSCKQGLWLSLANKLVFVFHSNGYSKFACGSWHNDSHLFHPVPLKFDDGLLKKVFSTLGISH